MKLEQEQQQWFDDMFRRIGTFRPTIGVQERVEEREDIETFHTLEVVDVTENVVSAIGPLSTPLGTIVKYSEDNYGLVFDLQRQKGTEGADDSAFIQTIVLGNSQDIKSGDMIRSTEQVLAIPVGDTIIGQIIDPLGRQLDGDGDEIVSDKRYPLFARAPTILERAAVNRPVHLGKNTIDLLFPIGRGQRELIIGDQGTGKTALAVDTIIAQKDQHMTCVYVAIGKKMLEIARIIDKLRETGAMEYTTIIIAPANAPDGLKYLAPYSGMAIAEGIMKQGKDALLIIDDLSLHAQAYRKVASDLGFPLGREGYPGDMFEQHSMLLERGGQLAKENGEQGGSITVLPIVILKGDATAYIPTNVVSITDGQLYLNQSLGDKGIMPPINTRTSVSRIGSKAQPEAVRNASRGLMALLTTYHRLAETGMTGVKDPTTQRMYNRGLLFEEILKQSQYDIMPFPDQAILAFAVMNGFLDRVPEKEIKEFVFTLMKSIYSRYPGFIQNIECGNATLNPKKDDSVEILTEILTTLIQEHYPDSAEVSPSEASPELQEIIQLGARIENYIKRKKGLFS